MSESDEVGGPVRRCSGCDEEWPDDEEFFHEGSDVCIACETERESIRRRSVAQAARRYRQRQRQELESLARSLGAT